MSLRALLAAGLLLVPLAGTPGQAAPPCPGREVSGPWTTVRVPSFPSGDVDANLHAVSASRPDLLYVSNGRAVLRSLDGGCRWSSVLSLPASPTQAQPFTARARIVAMAVPEAAAGATHLHLLVSDTPQEGVPNALGSLGAGVAATRTLSSYDTGSSWSTSAPLTPLEGTRGRRCSSLSSCVLTAAPSDPSVLYVGLGPGGVFLPAVLLRSGNAGRSWEPRRMPLDPVAPLPGGVATGGAPDVVEVDPLVPDTVWAKSGLNTFARSVDGGRSWTYVDTGYEFQMPALDVWRAKGAPSRLVALHSGENSTQTLNRQSTSLDGGATWTTRGVAEVGLGDVDADGVAHGRRSDDVVVSLTRPAGLRGWSPRARRYVDLDPAGLLRRHAPVSDVQASRESRPRFVLLGKGVLLTYRGPVGVDVPVRTTTVTTRR